MKIQFIGLQPHNVSLIGLPIAIDIADCETDDGSDCYVIAVWILWFNFAWVVTRDAERNQ